MYSTYPEITTILIGLSKNFHTDAPGKFVTETQIYFLLICTGFWSSYIQWNLCINAWSTSDQEVLAFIYVTLFWKTIHLGTLANFLFHSYNEALSGYLSCVKIL